MCLTDFLSQTTGRLLNSWALSLNISAKAQSKEGLILKRSWALLLSKGVNSKEIHARPTHFFKKDDFIKRNVVSLDWRGQRWN